jgi:ParB family transcriptional regulator, chromosome partitioning protein
MTGLKKSLDKFNVLEIPDQIKPHSTAEQSSQAAQTNAPKLHSGPGGMVAFSSQLNSANDTITKLEAQLKQFEGGLPTKSLDPQRVRFSRSANRHEQHWKTAAFRMFKEELRSSGGNVVPILVRPIKGDPDAEFEVTYGHRRTKGCQELNLPLLAIIQDLSDLEQWLLMARENMHREDLTPYELGDMYANAINDSIFENANQLASYFEKSRAHVSQALKLRRLPQLVIDAFPSPYDLQYRWADKLTERLATNAKPIIEIARTLIKDKGSLSGAQVFSKLCPPEVKHKTTKLIARGKVVGQCVYANGAIRIELQKNVIEPDRLADLELAITDFVEKQ